MYWIYCPSSRDPGKYSRGLLTVRAYPPDLVLADVSMPVMSGFELLERLTELEPRFARVPFVFLTALADRLAAGGR